MDAPRFDALSKTLSASGTRRRVLGALAATPALGAIFAQFAGDAADARKRKADHGHGLDAEKKRKKKKKKKCKPQPQSETCAGTCGDVVNNCKQTVSCGPCTCIPNCSGKCAGGSNGCGGTCSGACGANQICDKGICHVCDVCGDGCPFDNMREAVREASAGDTLYVCPGTYPRFEGGEVASIETNLTVVGAGSGDDGTIFDGGGAESPFVVVEINDATVDLRSLTIKGGNRTTDIAGGLRVRRSTVTLTDVRVTGNYAPSGGGIVNESTSILTLKNSIVTGNTATDAAGIRNEGTLIFGAGNTVSGNTTGNCVNAIDGATGCPPE